MGAMSLWHWVVVLVIVLLVFGAGKLPNVMGDMAKGMKAFKKGMRDDDVTVDDPKLSDNKPGTDVPR